MNLFGKRPAAKAPVPAPSAAGRSASQEAIATIDTLRREIDVLEKKQIHLEQKSIASQESAKQKIQRKDKNGALLDLKRKKQYELQTTEVGKMIITLENQIMLIDRGNTSATVFSAMQQATNTMKLINSNISEEKVEKLMDEMQDIQDTQQAVTEALTGGVNDFEDDEDLLAELDLMSKEMQSEQLNSYVAAPATTTTAATAAPTFGNLPEVPRSRPVAAGAQANSAEDEELRALESLRAGMMA